MQTDSLVRFPLTTAGALNDFLALGLASLLKSKGVPNDAATTRAQAAIQHLGTTKVQAAMGSSQPWKEVKALANQVTPVFQLVLPSELEAAIARPAKRRRIKHRLSPNQDIARQGWKILC